MVQTPKTLRKDLFDSTYFDYLSSHFYANQSNTSVHLGSYVLSEVCIWLADCLFAWQRPAHPHLDKDGTATFYATRQFFPDVSETPAISRRVLHGELLYVTVAFIHDCTKAKMKHFKRRILSTHSITPFISPDPPPSAQPFQSRSGKMRPGGFGSTQLIQKFAQLAWYWCPPYASLKLSVSELKAWSNKNWNKRDRLTSSALQKLEWKMDITQVITPEWQIMVQPGPSFSELNKPFSLAEAQQPN